MTPAVPAGLTPARQRATSAAELLRKVRRIEIVTNRLVNEAVAGSYHSVFKGRGMEFEEVREYTPGDDIRSIDWNVTARSGVPFVKTYREERELTVLLMVDLSGSTQFGSVAQFKCDLAAEVCSLLAFSAIKNNDRVGLLLFSDRVERFVPPKKGKNHVLRVIREVLGHEVRRSATNIPTAIEHAMRVLKRKSVVFLISDFRAEGLRRPLAVINGRHDLVAVRIHDERERELPAAGFVAFEDPETGETIWADTFDAKFRELFAAAVARNNADLETTFKQLRVDNAVVEVGKPYLEPIMRIFRRRSSRF